MYQASTEMNFTGRYFVNMNLIEPETSLYPNTALKLAKELCMEHRNFCPGQQIVLE